MFWTINCATNAKAYEAVVSLLHTSVQMLHVCSITVNIVGARFMLDLAESFTSHSSKKVQIGLDRRHFVGVEYEMSICVEILW